MNYAGRINSFIFKGASVIDAIKEYRKMNGLTHLEFNYPEHIAGYDLNEIKGGKMKLGRKNREPENEAAEEIIDLTKLRKKELLEIMLRQSEEIDALREQVEELQQQLENREFNLSKVGSIAEASLAVTNIFEEAQEAAMLYLENLKRMAEQGMKK